MIPSTKNSQAIGNSCVSGISIDTFLTQKGPSCENCSEVPCARDSH